MRGGYRPGAGRKPLSVEERQAKREARNAARRKTPVLRENPPHRDPRSWAEKVPESFKRGLSNQAMRALIALGNAPALMNRDRPEFNPFKLPDFPPSVVPKDTKLRLAMDDALCETQNWASTQWAGFQFAGLASEGLVFPGYAYLSNLAIRPEYRIASETIADEMTRKWVRFRGVGENPAEEYDDDADDLDAMDREIQNDLKKGAKKGQGEFKPGAAKTADKSERIKELVDFMDHLGVKDAYYNAEMGGGLFGRMHLFHEIAQNDGSTPEGLKELMTDLGDGRGSISKSKIGPDSPLTGIRAIEPIWTYPTTYNTLNPLQRDWYNPQVWYTQGQQIHVSRLFRMVPRPVPDLLKPSFSFGGLSLTQMMTPYVDIWLQTRAAIARLIQSFSCMVLSTDLQAMLQDPNMGAAGLMARVQAANATRGNQGLWVLNKATETLENVSASLAGLHELQAQAQEHLLSVTRIPAVKYTGIQPTGLNASSEGEIVVFGDTITGMQERDFRPHLTVTVRFCMLSLWGEVDEDIVFDFVPLRELTEKEQAEVQKLKAETWDLLMNGTQSIGPTDVRKQLAADPDSGFNDIDPEEEPDLPEPREPDAGGKINLKGNTAYSGGEEPAGKSAPGGGGEDANPFGADVWEESKHPRRTDGKFGTGSGASKTGVPKKLATVQSVQKVGVSEAYRTNVRSLIKASSDPDEKIALAELVAESLARKHEKLKGLGRSEQAAETYRKMNKADLAIADMRRAREAQKLGVVKDPTKKLTTKQEAMSRVAAQWKGRLSSGLNLSYGNFMEFLSNAYRQGGPRAIRQLAEAATGQNFTNETKAIAALDLQRVKANEATHEKRVTEIKQNVLDVATKQGFRQDRIEFTNETYEFELNGRKLKASGTAHLNNGTIRIYMNEATPEFAKQLMSHEVMHIKFEDYIKSRDDKFGIAVGDVNKYKESDGVTDYSREYWTQYQRDPNHRTLKSAFHETLAEIAAQEAKGLTVGAPEWRSLYGEVNSHWSKGRMA